jgi:hypothetical protein
MVIPPDGEWGQYRILIFHARGVPWGPARPGSAYANILLCLCSNSRIYLYTDVARIQHCGISATVDNYPEVLACG